MMDSHYDLLHVPLPLLEKVEPLVAFGAGEDLIKVPPPPPLHLHLTQRIYILLCDARVVHSTSVHLVVVVVVVGSLPHLSGAVQTVLFDEFFNQFIRPSVLRGEGARLGTDDL